MRRSLSSSQRRRPAVYSIACIPTGRHYIGRTVDVRRRFTEHRSSLRRGLHPCHDLQIDWSRYGEAAFQFKVVAPLPGATKQQIALLEATEVHRHETVFARQTYNSRSSHACSIVNRAGSDMYIESTRICQAPTSQLELFLPSDLRPSTLQFELFLNN